MPTLTRLTRTVGLLSMTLLAQAQKILFMSVLVEVLTSRRLTRTVGLLSMTPLEQT